MVLTLAIAALSLALPALAAPATEPCESCHDQRAKLAGKAHAAVACATCHERHESYPHPANVPKPVCGTCHAQQSTDYEHSIHGKTAKQGGAAPDCGLCHGKAHELISPKSATFRAGVVDTCAMCHDQVAAEYRKSVHGTAQAAGIGQAPLCTDCHGEHRILPPSDEESLVAPRHVRDTCGNCHGNVRLAGRFGLPRDRLVSFDASFHGLAAKAGSQTVANCASCHGVHNILPSADARSSTNPKNLGHTCGKCHPGAGERFAMTAVHVADGAAESTGVRWVRILYQFLIPLTIGLMLLHNGGDWLRKLWKRRFAAAAWRVQTAARRNVRMLPFERIQHAVLVLSFSVLVWTGFALKYPDQWWARPLLLWEVHGPVRAILHRTAAAVFVAVCVTHAVSLIVSRRLRTHWKELLPKISDAREFAANFAYNTGVRPDQPLRSSHSYVEKAEYWAVVWGAAVMSASGLMLWLNNLMLRFAPKEWLDVAASVHFYEAVLATLAIVVWHFYSAIFDPDVYPLDTAFLTGVKPAAGEIKTQENP